MKKFLTVIFCLFIFLSGTTFVVAQTAFPGTVIRLPAEEPYFDVHAEPGKTYSGSFIVQHQYEDPKKVVVLYINASDFEYDSKTGTTVYPQNSFQFDKATSIVNWITFNQSQIRMDHFGQETEVKYTIRVPKDALPGTHYANILVSNASPEMQIGKQPTASFEGAGVVSRLVATSVLVTVSGEREQSVRVTNLKVTDPTDGDGFLNLFHNLAPVTVVATIENNGNQVLLPGGDIFIHTGDNTSPAFHAPLNEARIRILPNTTRELQATWDDSFISAHGDGNIQIDLHKFGSINWGRYFAEVDLLYETLDGRLQKDTVVIPFWILPWRFVLVIALFVVIVTLAVMYYRRRRVEVLPNPLFVPRRRKSTSR